MISNTFGHIFSWNFISVLSMKYFLQTFLSFLKFYFCLLFHNLFNSLHTKYLYCSFYIEYVFSLSLLCEILYSSFEINSNLKFITLFPHDSRLITFWFVLPSYSYCIKSKKWKVIATKDFITECKYNFLKFILLP